MEITVLTEAFLLVQKEMLSEKKTTLFLYSYFTVTLSKDNKSNIKTSHVIIHFHYQILG